MKRSRQKLAACRPLHQMKNPPANKHNTKSMSLGSWPYIFEAESVERGMDRNSNKDLPQQPYTFRRGPTWGGAHEHLLHLVDCGREGKAQDRFAHAVSWNIREVSGSSIHRRLRELFAETDGRFRGMGESILSHRRWGASTSIFVLRQCAGGCYRALVSGY